MLRLTHILLSVVLAVVLAGSVVACSSSEEDAAPAPAARAAAAPAGQVSEQQAQSPAPAPPAPAPAAATEPPEQGPAGFDLNRVQTALVQQQRVIIRTVDLELVVGDVASSVDEIAAVARRFGGWVVSSERTSKHDAIVSVRVPAQSLDEAVFGIREVGIEVVSELSSSLDVTEDYVDTKSRLTSLRATEQALLSLFERAVEVEDALEVQNQLATLQANIEAMLGRIRYMEETAAFSLINVSVELPPTVLPVDAGGDRVVRAGEPARYQAHFTPPPGIEEFTFSWDFGDHSSPVTGTGHAPTTVSGQHVTATVSHVYESDIDSPYIVRLKITGTGDAGLAIGSATLRTTVRKIPTIEAYAGSDRTVEQGQSAEYTASFTRSDELANFRYTWDFGDGTAPVTGSPEPGESRITVTHAFDNHRPQAYRVAFTVTADSDAGEVTGSSGFGVRVEESEGLVIAGWSAGKNFREASRALSAVLQVIGTVLIWVATFSPIWATIAVVVFVVVRFKDRPLVSPIARVFSSSPSTPRRVEAEAEPSSEAPTSQEDEVADSEPQSRSD
ncbi:MAG: DUF4349 domain-containing protein [Dehalococcoidia bacterium]|nr:DUF4349 domain-containing protein [Dehalococcoidia bacterium]